MCMWGQMEIRERSHAAQRLCSIKGQAGLLGDRVADLYVIPSRQTGKNYRACLAQILAELLYASSLALTASIWILHFRDNVFPAVEPFHG
ncbi:hypothetical protein AVEN_103537-1 [Araneus ventricosus]|uniref:Uncharacterized protein n=1 Tax=Araneus ventricosus TaxID=182803 RepID=A0A4Y2WRI2_ARAVE|nr:hypothetical protein AVEN_103537-1 [Araneus ventricosus]